MSEMDVEQYVAAMPQGMGALNEKMGVELLEVSDDDLCRFQRERAMKEARARERDLFGVGQALPGVLEELFQGAFAR